LALFSLTTFASGPTQAPENLQAFYGRNTDYPEALTNADDVTLQWTRGDPAITGWKLVKRAWGDAKGQTITLPAKTTRYLDTAALAQVPIVSYQLAALRDGKTSDYARATGWRLQRLYPDQPTWSWPETEVWIANAPGRSPALTRHGESRLALKDLGAWKQLSEQIDGIVLFYSTIQNATIGELREFARALAPTRTRGRIKIAIELGVFHSSVHLEDPAGQQRAGLDSFAAQFRTLRRFTDPVEQGGAGGVIDVLCLDGPIHRAKFHQGRRTGLSTADAAEQAVQWMEQFRRAYPQVQFQLIANFSSWSYAGIPARNTRAHAEGPRGFGNYEDELATLPSLAARRGVPLMGVITDFAYDAFNNESSTDQPEVVRGLDYRRRLLALRNDVVALPLGPGGAPLRFGMLVNSNRGTSTSNYAARVELLNYLEELHTLGLTPSIVMLETWNDYPDRWLPETRKDTMTHLAWRVFNRLRHGREITTDNAP